MVLLVFGIHLQQSPLLGNQYLIISYCSNITNGRRVKIAQLEEEQLLMAIHVCKTLPLYKLSVLLKSYRDI